MPLAGLGPLLTPGLTIFGLRDPLFCGLRPGLMLNPGLGCPGLTLSTGLTVAPTGLTFPGGRGTPRTIPPLTGAGPPRPRGTPRTGAPLIGC